MRFHVFRYLSKPIDRQRLFRNLNDALDLYHSRLVKVPVETRQGVHVLPVSSIIMVEAQGKKVTVHTTTQDFESIHTMQYWLEHLPSNRFFQTHRSFIVNYEHITDFDHMLVHLANGQFDAYLTKRKYSAFFLLLMNLLVFGINQYNRKKNQEYTEMQLLLQKETDFTEYYKMLLSQSENQAILIHDIKKHLQSIASLNEQNAPEKVSAYINELLLSSDFKESARICDNELLNAIMARYRRQCNEQGISFTADIRSGVLNFLPDSDLTSLFCNLLDNAMEAAGKVPDSYIEINGSKRENTPFVLITVVNSCRVNPFKDTASDPATTKSDKRSHGFGLKSIRKICEKYHGDIQMYYNDATLTFHTVITLRG